MSEHQTMNAAYIARINKVFDYIEANLDKAMTLEELAEVAHFSKFHFARMFHSMVGETPFQFILRIRLERAASLLTTDKKENITHIAWKCGFSDISLFSRHFSAYFDKSPSRYRKDKRIDSNISQQHSNSDQTDEKPRLYFSPDLLTLKWRTNMNLNKSVEIRQMPEMTVAYIRHIGPYKGDDKLFERLWTKLFSWAGPRGLIGGEHFKSLVIYHDDPNVTTEDKLRMSVCITVPPETKIEGEVGKMQLAAANYVIARFELTAQDFQQAWDWLYGEWMPQSGYQPDDKPCFEMYPEEPKDGKFIVDICVPVKPC